MGRLARIVICLLILPAAGTASTGFYDDFEDNYIGDWNQRCQSGSWSASSGQANASTAYNCSALLAPYLPPGCNVTCTTAGTAVHVLGMVARLDPADSGIYAYVSPDHDVARIRRVSGGVCSTILQSLTAPFPSNEEYLLTLTCQGQSITLLIQVPALGLSWQLSALDPSPMVIGSCGLATGDEPGAHWSWFSVEPMTGVEHETPGIVPLSLEAGPNPFSEAVGITLAGDGAEGAVVRIYDMGGREVRSLLPAAGSTLLWSGDGEDGEPLPPGVYLLRCECGGEVLTSRVVRTL